MFSSRLCSTVGVDLGSRKVLGEVPHLVLCVFGRRGCSWPSRTCLSGAAAGTTVASVKVGISFHAERLNVTFLEGQKSEWGNSHVILGFSQLLRVSAQGTGGLEGSSCALVTQKLLLRVRGVPQLGGAGPAPRRHQLWFLMACVSQRAHVGWLYSPSLLLVGQRTF